MSTQQEFAMRYTNSYRRSFLQLPETFRFEGPEEYGEISMRWLSGTKWFGRSKKNRAVTITWCSEKNEATARLNGEIMKTWRQER